MAAAALDPYATLGIPVGANRDEAARAHRRLAKAFHPDINPGPASAERMRRINEAWRILSDPARRARFDADHQAAAWTGPMTWAGSSYTSRTRNATWATWPESRVAAAPRVRRPSRPDPVEPSFGDRPVVFFAVSAVLGLLYFIGAWLGSI